MTGPVSREDPCNGGGPYPFPLPSKTAVAKNLTTFFAKSLFDVNMVPV